MTGASLVFEPRAASIQRWISRRYLVLPGFYDVNEATEMLDQARKLLNDFQIEGHPLVGRIFKRSSEERKQS